MDQSRLGRNRKGWTQHYREGDNKPPHPPPGTSTRTTTCSTCKSAPPPPVALHTRDKTDTTDMKDMTDMTDTTLKHIFAKICDVLYASSYRVIVCLRHDEPFSLPNNCCCIKVDCTDANISSIAYVVQSCSILPLAS